MGDRQFLIQKLGEPLFQQLMALDRDTRMSLCFHLAPNDWIMMQKSGLADEFEKYKSEKRDS